MNWNNCFQNETFLEQKSSKSYEYRINIEGSCENDDWSIDAKNPALHHRYKLHWNVYSIIKQLF